MKRRPAKWLLDLLILCVLAGLAYAFGQALVSHDWVATIILFVVTVMCLLPLIVLALFDD